MAPYRDGVEQRSETKIGLEQAVRERAYLLWEKEGCPEGARRNIGIGLVTNTPASGAMCYGNRKEARKGGKMNTGVGFVTSRRSDFVSRDVSLEKSGLSATKN